MMSDDEKRAVRWSRQFQLILVRVVPKNDLSRPSIEVIMGIFIFRKVKTLFVHLPASVLLCIMPDLVYWVLSLDGCL